MDFVEVPIVVVNTQIEELEKHVTPKHVPLVIPKIGVGAKVTLINIVIHTSKVFMTLYIVLKDIPIVERLGSKIIPLTEPVDTTSEEHVDDLATRVRHVVLCVFNQLSSSF